MIQKNNLKVVLVGLFFCIQTSFAQSGFIGKKNEISLDLYSPIFKGQFEIDYKYSFKKHSSFFLDFGIINTTIDIPKQNGAGTLYLSSLPSSATASGKKVGIGILWNSEIPAMNMPIGYYSGFSMEFYKGNLINSYNPKDINMIGHYINSNLSTPFQNGTTVEFPFSVTGYNINFHFGKDFYISKNITLDILAKLGLGYYAFKAINYSYIDSDNGDPYIVGEYEKYYNNYGYSVKDKNGRYYVKNEGFILLPDIAPRSYYTILDNSSPLYGVDNLDLFNPSTNGQIPNYDKIRLLFLVQVKLGYLF